MLYAVSPKLISDRAPEFHTRPALRHRRLRVDLASRRLRRGDAGGHQADRPHCADRGPCRRRQFSCDRTYRRRRPKEIEAADAFASRLAHRAIAMGGACTGEHGIGQKKIPYMEDERGAAALDLMRRVKATFDPRKLFNPGKVFAA